MPGERVKVLYVLGFGRSGSTILDLLLGHLEECFSTGELQSLWRESLLEGRLCGCGVPVAQCPLWVEILGGTACAHLGASPEEVAALQTERLHLPVHGPRFPLVRRSEADWRRYGAVLERLYSRIAEVTRANVVVDSSKLPSVAHVLEQLPSVQPYYLHLVRDPRAVAYSWMRTKRAVDRVGGGDFERLSAVRSTLTWVTRHVAAERVRAHAPGREMLVRYEDLVASPGDALTRVAEVVGVSPPDADLFSGAAVPSAPNHTVSGNPVRLQDGPVVLREDTEWRAGLPHRARAVISTLSWPLLHRYGYA